MEASNTRGNFIRKFIKISKVALYAFAGVILLYLSVNALLNGNAWRSFGEGFGVTLFRILALVFAVLCSVFVGDLLDKLIHKYTSAEIIVVSVVAMIFWGINVWWVSKVPYVMEGDQAVIWQNAVLNLKGDFSMFAKGGQIFIYPQQQGLSFLYEMLFKLTGSTSYKMIGYLNASLAPFTLICGYDCVKMCFSKESAVRFLPLMLLCLPYTIYAPYVYGDIPSIALTFILLWAILKQANSGKKRYYIVACMVAAIALFCRMNVWICFIGIVIGLFYHCIHKKSVKPFVFALAIVLSASLSMTCLKEWNASRANEPVSKGMPSVLWMAMGLQYSEYGAGYYNDYSKRIFKDVDYDRELASGIAKQEIKDRIHIFLSDSYQTKLFFEEKIKSQWEDGLFESIKFTGTFSDLSANNLPNIVAKLYYGDAYARVKHFTEYMLCIVYVFALVGVVKRFFEEESLLKDIPLIIFVGGFLFSIFWEAKARYMLPYYVLLHMYAAYGMVIKSTKIKTFLNKYLCKKDAIEV